MPQPSFLTAPRFDEADPTRRAAMVHAVAVTLGGLMVAFMGATVVVLPAYAVDLRVHRVDPRR